MFICSISIRQGSNYLENKLRIKHVSGRTEQPVHSTQLTMNLCTVYDQINSMLGARADLPCNITLPASDDAINLIFWYKGNISRVPIYTVDGRKSSTLDNATHFPSDIFQPNRAKFITDSLRYSSLRIEPTIEEDHGDYRCRVDFKWGRTINSFVSLSVAGKCCGTQA